MTADYNNVATTGLKTSQGSPLVQAVTVNAGSNHGVLVLLGHSGPYNTQTVTGVKWGTASDGSGGTAMTLVPNSGITDDAGNTRTEIYWIGQGSVTDGATYFAVALSGTMSDIVATAIVLDGADQGAAPLETAATSLFNSNGNATLAPTSAVDELVACICLGDQASSGSVTTGTGTERSNSGASGDITTGVATLPGAADTTAFAWTVTNCVGGSASGVAWKAAVAPPAGTGQIMDNFNPIFGRQILR